MNASQDLGAPEERHYVLTVQQDTSMFLLNSKNSCKFLLF